MISLPVYDNRYIKTKIRANGDKVYINFRSLNVPGDDVECNLLQSLLLILCLFMRAKVVYILVVLGHFAPRGIFGLGIMRTFCPLGYLWAWEG